MRSKGTVCVCVCLLLYISLLECLLSHKPYDLLKIMTASYRGSQGAEQ